MRVIASAGGVAAAVVLALTGSACSGSGTASTSSTTLRPEAARHAPQSYTLRLQAMPAGAVTFGKDSHGRLAARVAMYGLLPGSSDDVDLLIPGRTVRVRFSRLKANAAGQADTVLHSNFTGVLPSGSRLLIATGAAGGGAAGQRVAETGPLMISGLGANRLMRATIKAQDPQPGTPQGAATLSYDPSRHTLTVKVHATGLTPGRHAAHIHVGSCLSQGPIRFALKDLVADSRGRIRHAVQVFTNVAQPIPAHGWYLNLHQGDSANIVRHGQPTVYFRPLLCADIG